MRFDARAFRLVLTDADAARAAWLILLGSALMLAATQSIVLFANRVPPLRFLLALGVSGLRYALVAIGYGVAVIVAGRLLGASGTGQIGVLALVALAWAPGLLSLFSVVPHFGLGWQRIVDAWIAALQISGLVYGLGMSVPTAAAVGLAGWLLGEGASFLAGPMLGRINWRMLEAVAGRDLVQDADPLAVLRAQAAARQPRP